MISKIKNLIIKHRKGLGLVLLSTLTISAFVGFFNKIFISGMYLSAADFLFIWHPWASVRPETFIGVQNHIVSDWVDAAIPNLKYIRSAGLELIIDGYRIGSNWGHPASSILGVSNLHEPLTLFFIKVGGIKLGSTLLSLSRPMLAFLGMFVLLRKMKVNKYLTLISSAALSFSIPLISANYGGSIMGLIIMPFLFYAVLCLIKEFNIKNLVIYIVLTIWLITTGFPTTIAYGVIFSVLFFIINLFFDGRKDPKKKILILTYFLIINILILGVWSWSLIPNLANLNAMDLGYRDGNGLKRLPFNRFFQWIYPNYCGNGTTISWICGAGNWIESSMSSGIISILLLLIGIPGLFYKKIKSRKEIIFFYILSFIVLALIFNWFKISSITNLIPLLNINSNTRLIFLLPFFVVTAGGLGLDLVIKDFENNKRFSWIVWSVLVSVIGILFTINFEYFRSHLTQLSNEILFAELKHNIFIIVSSILLLGVSIVIKKKWLRKISLILVFFLSVFDLNYYNQGFLSYQYPEDIFPTTEGIEFLQTNMESEDRILVIERVFLPNTNEYYGINALTGHDWRTESFNDVMQPIQPGVFETAGTLQFLDREKVVLTEETKNYLRFNRVKYIIQSPDALEPNYDIEFEQIYIDTRVEIIDPIEYQIPLEVKTYSPAIDLYGTCDSEIPVTFESSDFEVSIIKVSGERLDLPIKEVIGDCDLGTIALKTQEISIEEGDVVSIGIHDVENWTFAVWSSRDLNKETEMVGTEDVYELVLKVYDENPITYPTVYTDDLLISEVTKDTSTAYFYDCEDLSEDLCRYELSTFEIDDPMNLDEFNDLYSKFVEVPFIEYEAGEIVLDTSKIQSPGVLILSDNYFRGWNSSRGECFKGFLGSLNVHVEDTEKDLKLVYTNEYLLLSVGISLASLGLLILILVRIKRRRINP